MPGPMLFCPLVLSLAFLSLALSSTAIPIALYGQAAPAGDGSISAPQPIPQKFVQMLNTQVVWDQGLNHPSGPRLRFVKIAESNGADGHFTRYRVFAYGMQEGTPYIFAAWNIGTPIDDLHVLSNAIYVNRKGLLLTRKPTAAEEDRETAAEGVEYELKVQAADGEPLRYLLRSSDNMVLTPGTLVPFPVESTDNHCKLSAVLAAPEGEALLIDGDGFPPNAEVEVQGNSVGTITQSAKTVDANGHVEFVELPFVAGKDTGAFQATISTPDCTVSVSIPWGKGSYRKH